MGFYEGFDLGKYGTTDDIQPDTRKIAFWKQIRILIHFRWIISRNFRYFDHKTKCLAELYNSEDPLDYDDCKDCNDAGGDDFISSIIQQRQGMLLKLRMEIRNKEMEDAKDENWLRGMKLETLKAEYARVNEIERLEDEKEKEEHRMRVDKANAHLQVDLYNRRQKRLAKEKKEQFYKQREIEWHAHMAKMKKANKK